MASNALAAFNRRVKQLKKQHPKMSHKQAQKAASRAHKAKKVSGTKKHKRVSGKAKEIRKHRVGGVTRSPDRGADNKKVDISIGSATVPQLKSKAKEILKERMAWLYVTLSSTTKKPAGESS